MGISLGPEAFQKKMNEILAGLDGCDVVVDDILVWGKTKKEHDDRLTAVVERIKNSGLKLKESKCCIRQSEVKFFGHFLSAQGIRPDPDKVNAICDMPSPTNVTELMSMNGMVNYLSRFIPDLAKTWKPVTDLLKSSVIWQWTSLQQKAFEDVKAQLKTLPTLTYYKTDRPTVVSADASSYGIGAVLLQKNGEILEPIAFASRTLTSTESKWAQIEKESLASLWACEKFSKYLIGLYSFELLIGHKPLVPLILTKDLDKAPVRCRRLPLRLMPFNAKVKYVQCFYMF